MRALGADDAYAMGFAGQSINVGLVDSGYFLGHYLEHSAYPNSADPSAPTRYHSIDATGGTTGFTQGFYNQTYNDSHGTHVSGTVGAARDGGPGTNGTNNMHGVDFDANVYLGNTHKTDGVYYGFQPANATDALLLDNAYIGNIYRAGIGYPIRHIHSSWGSQPSTENYNTYETPPGAPSTFGLKSSWMYLSTPDGVADGNGHTVHWLQGAIAAARAGLIVQFSAGNMGYANTTPRGSSSYFMPDLEGHWYTVTGLTTNAQTFNADGSVRVPGTENFNQCGVAKWACVSAPGNSINSTIVQVVSGVPTANYGSSSGTSMSGPHAAAALGLFMQRFPYMTNPQVLYTMFSTARQNQTINNASGTAITNPGAGTMVQIPDNRNGWGTPNFRDGFKGPAQFFGGNMAVNTQGFNDVWSNDISNVALDFRKTEDAAEDAAWQATVAARGWQNGLPPNASANDQADFQIGTARAAARATRNYSGSLTKLGNGNLFLGGNVNVPGTTTVAGGKLSIMATHTPPIMVNGGTLGGKGAIVGSLTVMTGTLSPGLGPDDVASIQNFTLTPGNVLSASAVKLGPSANYVATIRSNTDFTQLQATGMVALGGNLMISLNGPVSAPLTVIHTTGSLVGTFKGLPEGAVFTAAGQVFRISYQGGSVTLTPQNT
jgi:subtilase-type serine protease